jgi:DNA-binding MarR family transcriptional regulator
MVPEPPAPGLSRAQYATLAAFRHALRRFLSFSEAAAAAAGLPPQQHQALLAIAGHAGPGAPTAGSLAEHLIIAPHSAAELVARMVETGLLRKAPGAADRRRQELALTPKAATLLAGLTDAHLQELAKLAPALAQVLDGLVLDGLAAGPGRTPG